MKTRYKYVKFLMVAGNWYCYCKNGDLLGSVRYYSPWKQFVFAPEAHTEFSACCLADIQHFLVQFGVGETND